MTKANLSQKPACRIGKTVKGALRFFLCLCFRTRDLSFAQGVAS
eukprot:CAMPEP_0171894204 /NCGR_PEP_ID=MMETSP0992-20121227/46344_1 /TAXON_ID=483369 /ORGANISM="non described non described, Strain CCMP2098" /LENGTH=43 /DNA_ID= /DNA_START= /DNA_END= /DNA_ORIENTATION=